MCEAGAASGRGVQGGWLEISVFEPLEHSVLDVAHVGRSSGLQSRTRWDIRALV